METSLNNVKKQLRERGWAKIKVDDDKKILNLKMELFNGLLLNKNIFNAFKKNSITDIDSLRIKSKNLNSEVINDIRKVYVNDLSIKTLNCFSENIKNIFGSDILIQRYPQIQVHVTNKTSTKTSPHIEVMAGHSPYTFNFWVPFHNVDFKTGIFIVDADKSVELCDFEINNVIQNRLEILKDHLHFPKVNIGEALLFNGFVYHGSVDHTSEKARISVDVRLQSSIKPLFQKFNEFFKMVKL